MFRTAERDRCKDFDIFFCFSVIKHSALFMFQSNNNDDSESWREMFKKKMYDGYEMALKQGNPVSFMFRGVETTLHPDQQEVDDNMIEIRINDVLKELKKKSNVRIIMLLILRFLPTISKNVFFFSFFFPELQGANKFRFFCGFDTFDA